MKIRLTGNETTGFVRSLLIGKAAVTFEDSVVGTADFVEEGHRHLARPTYLTMGVVVNTPSDTVANAFPCGDSAKSNITEGVGVTGISISLLPVAAS